MSHSELHREFLAIETDHPIMCARILNSPSASDLPPAVLLGLLCSCRLSVDSNEALLHALGATHTTASACTEQHLDELWAELRGSAHWGQLARLHAALARLMGWQVPALPHLTFLKEHTAKPTEHGVGFSARRMASVQRETQWLGCLRALHWLAAGRTVPALGSPGLPLDASRLNTEDSSTTELSDAGRAIDPGVAALVSWLWAVRRSAAWSGARGPLFTAGGGGDSSGSVLTHVLPRRAAVLSRRRRRQELLHRV